MSTRVRHVREANTGSATVYIGRANARLHLAQSDWHNPFRMSKDNVEQREWVVRQFAGYLIQRDDLFQRLYEGELRDTTLQCYCHPKLCHGHILAILSIPEVYHDPHFKPFPRQQPVDAYDVAGGLLAAAKRVRDAAAQADRYRENGQRANEQLEHMQWLVQQAKVSEDAKRIKHAQDSLDKASEAVKELRLARFDAQRFSHWAIKLTQEYLYEWRVAHQAQPQTDRLFA